LASWARSLGRGARLARSLAPRHRLLRACSHFDAAGQTEAREWLARARMHHRTRPSARSGRRRRVSPVAPEQSCVSRRRRACDRDPRRPRGRRPTGGIKVRRAIGSVPATWSPIVRARADRVGGPGAQRWRPRPPTAITSMPACVLRRSPVSPPRSPRRNRLRMWRHN
jgi:hypothetical protein